MQKFILCVSVLWALSACGQPTTSAPTATNVPPTPPITMPTATIVPTAIPIATITPPPARAEADPVVWQTVQDLGYGLVESEYIARTGIASQQRDATTWHIIMTTPTGYYIDQTIQYARGNSADIDQPVQMAPISPATPDSFAYSYTVSAQDAPPEIRDAIGNAPLAWGATRMMMIAPPVQVAGDVDAILVTITGFIKQYGKDQLSDFAKTFQQMHPDKIKLNDMWNGLKAGMYVNDAFWMFEKIWPYLNALDYLQACAANPWNPLTKKSYQDFPQDKQRILDRLESARAEIKYEGMYMYTVVMNKVLFMGVPGLQTATKFILGKTLDNFIKETEQRLKNLVAEMEKMVTPCNGWRYVQNAQAGYPFTFEGTKCSGIDGNWTIEDDTKIETMQIVSKIEVTVSEAEWIKGKKDFRWTLEQTSTTAETRGETMIQGFTKDIIFANQSIQYIFDNPLICRWSFSPSGAQINGCAEILKMVQFNAIPNSAWVEDPAICQVEKANMIQFGKP